MPSSADKVTYEVNERVLAVNSGLMYEAKILKVALPLNTRYM
jgi:hypothetical protein